jgi:hypothetical protein
MIFGPPYFPDALLYGEDGPAPSFASLLGGGKRKRSKQHARRSDEPIVPRITVPRPARVLVPKPRNAPRARAVVLPAAPTAAAVAAPAVVEVPPKPLRLIRSTDTAQSEVVAEMAQLNVALRLLVQELAAFVSRMK